MINLLNDPEEKDWLNYWKERNPDWEKLSVLVRDFVRAEAKVAFKAGQSAERSKND